MFKAKGGIIKLHTEGIIGGQARDPWHGDAIVWGSRVNIEILGRLGGQGVVNVSGQQGAGRWIAQIVDHFAVDMSAAIR